VGVGGFRGSDDLFVARADFTECNVLADGAAKQLHDLADVSDLTAQRMPRHGGDILPIKEDAPGFDVVKS
jgi:hypothetical protein